MSTTASAVLTSANTARDAAYATPLDQLDPSRPESFAADEMWWNFERLRAEAPVHYTANSAYGPFWSVTKYNDIMAVDIDHHTFSSEPGIMMVPPLAPGETPQLEGLAMFIAMDPPKHDVQRKAVSPAVSPTNLQILGPLIRERAAAILDGLPIGKEFDWVDKVSMELTAMTLATLFGMPQEDRRKLTYWSDVVTAEPGHGLVETREQKMGIFRDYHAYFTQLWNDRVNAEPTGDLISMLAHDPATRDVEFRGQHIKQDDTVVMWYVSGNRDDEVIDRPNDYIIDRPRPRQHISFGFGVHRCVGNRLAELQLQIVWEEIMKRFPEINVVAEPKRVRSNFVKGYETMRVSIPRRY